MLYLTTDFSFKSFEYEEAPMIRLNRHDLKQVKKNELKNRFINLLIKENLLFVIFNENSNISFRIPGLFVTKFL